MQLKKKQILDGAIHCFAKKGFHATSIQEIVDELGIAKGSIYFYFKSKDDLLISVFEHYMEMLFDRMKGLPDEWELPPREKLSLQLERQFQFFREHLDFMRMLMKEPLNGLHPHIQQLMHRLRARTKLWYLSHIMDIYGKRSVCYHGDLSTLLSGIVSPYFETILMGEAQFDDRRLSQYLIRRLDDLMAGIESANESPILPNPSIDKLRECAGMDMGIDVALGDIIHAMVEDITALEVDLDEQALADLLAALRILQEAAVNPLQANHLLVRGMVALLKQQGMKQWQGKLEQVENALMNH